MPFGFIISICNLCKKYIFSSTNWYVFFYMGEYTCKNGLREFLEFVGSSAKNASNLGMLQKQCQALMLRGKPSTIMGSLSDAPISSRRNSIFPCFSWGTVAVINWLKVTKKSPQDFGETWMILCQGVTREETEVERFI